MTQSHKIRALVGLLLLSILSKMADANAGVILCSSENGKLMLEDGYAHIFTVKEADNSTSVFVNRQSNYSFQCRFFRPDESQKPAIAFGSDKKLVNSYSNGTFTKRQLLTDKLDNVNHIQKAPESVKCDNVCEVNLVIVSDSSSVEDKCTLNVTETLDCEIDEIEFGLVEPTKNSLPFIPFNIDITDTREPPVTGRDMPPARTPSSMPRSKNRFRGRFTTESSEEVDDDSMEKKKKEHFEQVIKYSVMDPAANQTWVPCKEIDDEGEVAETGTHLETDTKSIKCPIKLQNSSSRRPVLIRIEKVKSKDRISAALPILSTREPESEFTYFHLFVSTIVEIDPADPEQTGSEEKYAHHMKVILIVSILSVLVIVLATALIVVGVRKYRKSKAKSFHPRFYVDGYPMNNHPSKSMSSQFSDVVSTRTDTTVSNNYHLVMMNMVDEDPSDLFDDDLNDNSEEAVKKRKNIIQRQLSGDPAKINPSLALNSQAKVLPYNSQFEIDRSNFKIGKLLGSGNFGSVYEGTATGLFHPGSETKVAVKTVNDALDRSQLVALLCEMKILTNLDLHLNLVNLMGSCTSELFKGELWLLLEFSPHGDMKNFLIDHREEIKSSLKNKIAVNNLDERMFLKWSYDIAKGMEYLSGKRIMHGDLAARNILIGGLEGGLVAKVSDFGLSKTFYDNIRYKKQTRPYVPWKWMALEYLQDGCFTMKSDVWSYGVVLWEILSLGQEPYQDATDITETIKKIKQQDYRLPCPEDVIEHLDWIQEFYDKVTKSCWISDPGLRIGFGDLVKVLEDYLTEDEVKAHLELHDHYENMSKLMCDDTTREKRLVARQAIKEQNNLYHKMYSIGTADNPPQEGYVTVKQTGSAIDIATGSEDSHPEGYVSVEMVTNESNPNQSYITVTQAKALST